MAKQKAPTPQELYKARKAREEREKNALLPPGLINHGNTCFMNSVLQGIIATQYLESLVLFKPLPSVLQSASSHTSLASHRSPELTNGHGVGGEFELPWTAGLKIGDSFITVMQRAWALQKERKRESISPKDILSALGEKYDQYMDFRQQDAHEFLRQLLDAMRMEEHDIIKKRSRASSDKLESQPTEPEMTHSAQEDLHQTEVPETASSPKEEPTSFVDILFGGKLTSILVCQTCKHVSHTYEEFNDLSLSIKPEDYVRERKRDKLKKLARKLRDISGNALSVSIPTRRSSSVPATPVRDSVLDSPAEISDPQRRRSIDLGDVDVAAQPAGEEQEGTSPIQVVQDPPASRAPSPPTTGSSDPQESTMPTPPTDSVSANLDAAENTSALQPKDSTVDHVSFVETERVVGKDKKDKDESWAKLSRRISVTVGFSKSSKEHRRRTKEERKEKKGSSQTSSSGSLQPLEEASPSPVPPKAHSATEVGSTTPSTTLEREPTPLSAVNEKLQAQFASVKRSFTPVQRSSDSPSTSSTPRFPLITRPSTPASNNSKRSKQPRPPKLSTEEAAYLRDILADTNPPGLSRPFSIFKQPKDQAGTSSSTPQSIFLKLNQLGGVEECLRLFTAVEVLDGDNMVRCHRCWKIANGVYQPRTRGSAHDPDSCTDTDDDDADRANTKQDPPMSNSVPCRTNSATSTIEPSDSVPSYSTNSLLDTPKPQDTPQAVNTNLISNTTAGPSKLIPPSLQLNDDTSPLEPPVLDTLSQTFGIVISTTPPESPMSARTARPTPSRRTTASSSPTAVSVAVASSSRTSLSAPPDKHRREKDRGLDSTTESDGFSDDESETLLSAYSDISSAASPTISPNASQECLEAPSQLIQDASSQSKSMPRPSGVPRSKQFLMRPAYKRYLIATPPPILVIHLKRFQQSSKSPVVSFSTSFKKLDDYISFPEYLDLAPYLAPNREDYFGSRVATGRGRARRTDPCMYRLYAVVVHIGNMLGGHYIAYTALPPSPPEADSRPDNEKQQDRERPPRDWAYISDTVVRLTSLEEVLKSKAYLCMYERI